MILETVICDCCDNRSNMSGSVVPDAWLSRDGKHYCNTFCFMVSQGRDQ